jgi:tRNA 2-selenouridine synthase
MAAERISIEQFLELAKDHTVIDVRSPGEYKHAHIPGAHSLPLFTDEERKVVGTAYKQESREKAIKVGLDYFGPKMSHMVEEVEAILQRSAEPKLSTLNPKHPHGSPPQCPYRPKEMDPLFLGIPHALPRCVLRLPGREYQGTSRGSSA